MQSPDKFTVQLQSGATVAIVPNRTRDVTYILDARDDTGLVSAHLRVIDQFVVALQTHMQINPTLVVIKYLKHHSTTDAKGHLRGLNGVPFPTPPRPPPRQPELPPPRWARFDRSISRHPPHPQDPEWISYHAWTSYRREKDESDTQFARYNTALAVYNDWVHSYDQRQHLSVLITTEAEWQRKVETLKFWSPYHIYMNGNDVQNGFETFTYMNARGGRVHWDLAISLEQAALNFLGSVDQAGRNRSIR